MSKIPGKDLSWIGNSRTIPNKKDNSIRQYVHFFNKLT